MELNEKLRSTVYYNLHQHCFSVQQAGRVKAHTNGITMDQVRFNVAKAGQAKVRAEGKKNVHARVSGKDASPLHDDDITFMMRNRGPSGVLNAWGIREAKYNPYNDDWFVDSITGENVFEANKVWLVKRVGDGPAIFYLPYTGFLNTVAGYDVPSYLEGRAK